MHPRRIPRVIAKELEICKTFSEEFFKLTTQSKKYEEDLDALKGESELAAESRDRSEKNVDHRLSRTLIRVKTLEEYSVARCSPDRHLSNTRRLDKKAHLGFQAPSSS